MRAPRSKANPYPVRTKANADAIVAALCSGKPLTEICREQGLCTQSVYDWKDADPEFAGQIARARDVGFDVIATGVIDIIDDKTDDPASRRVRAEYRLKLLAKWDPKRYGDKLDLTSDNKAIPANNVAVFALPDNGRS